MTAINRLTNKPNPSGNDLVPIWDHASGRTRNSNLTSIIALAGNSIDPVVNIEFQSPNLVVTYYSGKVENVDLTP